MTLWDAELATLPGIRVRPFTGSQLFGLLRRCGWSMSAMTLGRTIWMHQHLIGTNDGAQTLRHEAVHVRDQARWGPLFFIPEVARKHLATEIGHAEKELQERRARKGWPPRWFGAVMLALLGSALKLLLRASPKVVMAVLTLGAFAASIFLLASLVLDTVFDSDVSQFAGYVRLLRLAKRRLDLQS